MHMLIVNINSGNCSSNFIFLGSKVSHWMDCIMRLTQVWVFDISHEDARLVHILVK